ncbi:MAG: M48 family metalloprotease [Haloarculaceae archaeon]
MDWRPDRRLRRRMALALALTLLGYAALLAPVVWLLPWQGWLVAGGVLVGILGLLTLEADLIAYWLTDAVAIERGQYPQLFDTVDRLAAQADLPRPPIAVVPTDEPNALSAGTGDRTAVLVTLGLLKTLDDDQLAAVLAHEIAHLKNGDSSALTVAGFPTAVAAALVGGGLDNVDLKAVVLGYVFVPLYLALLGLPLLLVSLPGTLALARYREYAADRGAVAITGDPVALATALGELYLQESPPETDLRRIAGLAPFCVLPTAATPLPVPSMHPPTHRRIRRLRKLAAELEGVDPGADG